MSLAANVFTVVKRTEACKKAGIPIKRGIILAGPPGTGKTLTSQELADVCQKNGWTFILLPDTRALPKAIHFARRYGPCVVFCEDIDCGPASEARGTRLNELLNTIDGINTKDAEVMLVFTTNDVSKIDRTLVRPGRIDAIIEFPRPKDAETIARFLHHYGKGLIVKGEELTRSCQLLEEQLPAIMRESVERAKLYALARGVEPDAIQLTDADIETSIITMQAHVEFFRSKKDVSYTVEEQLGRAVATVIRGEVGKIDSNVRLIAEKYCELDGVKK
jgi:ATP-dependent 26S proteasome regulatory subunit